MLYVQESLTISEMIHCPPQQTYHILKINLWNTYYIYQKIDK